MKEFFKKIGNGIKTKAKDFGNGLKAVFSGIKWISKEQYEELTKAMIKNRHDVGEAMDQDKDGGITTKDIADWFKEKHQLEKEGE